MAIKSSNFISREFAGRSGVVGFVLFLLLGVSTVQGAGDSVQINVLEDSGDRIVLEYELTGYELVPVKIDGQDYVRPQLAGEAEIEAVGKPAVPHVCRSIAIPDKARMVLKVTEAAFDELHDVQVIPSKGALPRTINPADVPYTFGSVYGVDEWYPAEPATLSDPYIMRDVRGTVVKFNPFQYNPVTQVLKVCTKAVIEIESDGLDTVNVLNRGTRSVEKSLAFHQIYKKHFLNYQSGGLRYTPLDEQGDMLIIAHDAWLSNVQPLVNHKNNGGINTTLVGVSTIGNNSTSIKNYIQSVYDSSNLAFVLLVGDHTQVATPTVTVDYSTGASDPSYSKLAGSDNYPDILVGRFSAETAAQVDTQVQRTVEYEQNAYMTQDWFKRAVGIASDEGTSGQGDDGESDIQHMNNIRTDLLGYGYTTVNQIHDPGATASEVAAAVNAGRGLINYVGHGDTTYWGTTGFSVSNINALTNDNQLPFIIDVACVNGEFDGYTCFAEAWMRATHGSEPTGAIGIYASSVNQSWASPMCGQDECNDLLVAEAYASLGAICFGGSCQMMDEYGSDGVDMFNTWHLFGDPSLKVLMTCSSLGNVSLDKPKYGCGSTATIEVNDCDLNGNDSLVETVTVHVESGTDPAGEDVTLTETGPATAVFNGTVVLSETGGTGAVQVIHGDTVLVTYIDADNGQGNTNVVVTVSAVVDCQQPVISNVRAQDVGPRSAAVVFSADEPVKGTVYWGNSCASLTETVSGGGYVSGPSLLITGLVPETTYYYTVAAEDEAGNSASADNGGLCYSFTTSAIPDFFTELFNTDFDLDNKRLTFTPNGTYDFYDGCVEDITELPTDPSTGTALSLTDDSYGTVVLSGGQEVDLYGQSYDRFYPVSNGYITFIHGETDYSETIAEHFSGVPKISALYDDLDPEDGGVVRWQQFADRVVVTWDGVPEHNESNPNTFQIEMYFDGMITISYLAIDATDGLVGLSRGEGTDPEFEESDLSAMIDCGPQPPMAFDGNASTMANESLIIALQGRDDGLPDPPAAIDFIVTSLPAHGELNDPNGGAIASVPYALLLGGNEVEYVADTNYYGSDSIHFKTNDGGSAPSGGDSEIATIVISVIANPPVTQNVNLNLDINTSVNVNLVGQDTDGDTLDFVIMTLPANGELSDPNGGVISAAPYTLLNNGQTVVYMPDTDYAGSDSFVYRANDSIFSSNLSTVSLTVIAEAPQIVTASLPDGNLNSAYGPLQLAVSGGQPELTWSLITDLDYVEENMGSCMFSETAGAMNWNQDEGFWLYDLPFSFPFYGETYTSIRVRPNGFINMGTFSGSTSVNSDAGLIGNTMIAPLWDDLRTTETGEDVFIDESVAGEVTIRWKGSAMASGNAAVDFAVVLSDDGSIRFDYGATNAGITPTIGVSAGDGVNYTLASINGLTSLSNANSLTFRIPISMPDGLSFNSAGVLSGIPTEAGDFEPVFKVVDSLGRVDQKLLNLHVSEFVAGDCDFDGDGDVDLADYAGFQVCFTGDGLGPAAAGCEVFYQDADGDIDEVDFAGFIAAIDR